MLKQDNLNSKIHKGAIAKRSLRTLKKDQDKQITKDLGRAMRFFLNLSFALMIAFPVCILFDSYFVTPIGMIVYLIPVLTTIILFIAFLRLLKQIEKYAAKKRNIELVSRIIWEFNQTSLIRLTIGKIQAFMEEE